MKLTKNDLKKEAIAIGTFTLCFIILFKIGFYKESFSIIFKTSTSIIWQFILPGYVASYIWKDKLNYLERLIVGTAIATALFGTLSYHLGLFGFHVKYHALTIPPLLLIFASILITLTKDNSSHPEKKSKKGIKKDAHSNH